MSPMTHTRRGLSLVLLVGTCLGILSFNPTSASIAPGLSHTDRLPPPSLAKRDLLGGLIGKPQSAPVTSSPSPGHNTGGGGGNSPSSSPPPTFPSNPKQDPDPTPDYTDSPYSTLPSSSPSSTSSKSPSGPLSDPGDNGDNDPDSKGKTPLSDATHTPTTSPTKKKAPAASSSGDSATSSDHSSGQHSPQQNGQAETSTSAIGTDNDPALGNNGLNGTNSNSTSSRSDQEGNSQGLTPGLIALLVTILLAITTAVVLSCYKIRQARTRTQRRRQRGLSATSGISNLVGSTDLETLSWHENLLKSSGGHTRNQSLQSHASHPNSLHHHHQLHHQLHHPYVGNVAYDAPATPPMAAAHIVGNRGGSPGRGSLGGGGRDDPWRKNLDAFHRE